MDVRAKNRGRPHQKVPFFCGEIEQNRRFVFQGLQNPIENRTKSAKIGVTPVRCPLLGDP